MKVSAIIVTYNRVQLLKKCINSLLNQSYKLDTIFVVNNNSTDGTKDYLSKLSNTIVEPINSHKNLGGAGGFCLGTKFAYKHSRSKYFWLMDDDTIARRDSLYKLMFSAKRINYNFGFLCSNVRWLKNNKPAYMNVPVASKDWTQSLNKNLVKVISASFVSLLVPRKLVRKLGLPIADMFIWADDVEYTTRLSRSNDSYLVSDSIVFHDSATNKKYASLLKLDSTSNSENLFNVARHRIFYYRCMYRNRLYISRKYYKYPKTIQLLLKDIYILIRTPFLSKNYRFKRFYNVLCGIISGLFFNPKIKFPMSESKKL